MNPEELAHKLYHNRRVAVVGGHDEVAWSLVNTCDTVVRINGHWGRQGGRCDVLYDSCADDFTRDFYFHEDFKARCQLIMANVMPMFVGADGHYRRVVKLCEEIDVPMDMYVHAPIGAWNTTKQLQNVPARHEWAKDFAARYGYPFTGILAAAHVAKHEPKTIYLDGMNFYKETSRHRNHDIQPQAQWVIDNLSVVTPGLSLLDTIIGAQIRQAARHAGS